MALYKRVIPVLLLQNGIIVRSEGFCRFNIFGNPIDQLIRLSEWDADELVYIDITRQLISNDTNIYDYVRKEHAHSISGGFLNIVKEIGKYACMPITFGGNVRTCEQVDLLIANGADKVLINTGLHLNPELTTEVAKKYGSQAMVSGIDIKEGKVCYGQGNIFSVRQTPNEYAKELEARGAGEILLNSIDRDGKGTGYELDLYSKIADSVSIPVVAMGGVGDFRQMIPALQSNLSAVAAGNIFNYTELAYPRCKKILKAGGCHVR